MPGFRGNVEEKIVSSRRFLASKRWSQSSQTSKLCCAHHQNQKVLANTAPASYCLASMCIVCISNARLSAFWPPAMKQSRGDMNRGRMLSYAQAAACRLRTVYFFSGHLLGWSRLRLLAAHAGTTIFILLAFTRLDYFASVEEMHCSIISFLKSRWTWTRTSLLWMQKQGYGLHI